MHGHLLCAGTNDFSICFPKAWHWSSDVKSHIWRANQGWWVPSWHGNEGKHSSLSEHMDECPLQYSYKETQPPKAQGRALAPPSTHFIALMDVVIYHLEQKPHHIPQDERGDQVPVDNIPQASDTPEQGNTFKWAYIVKIYPTHISNCIKKMSKFCSLQFIPLQSLCYSVKKEVCGFAKPSTTICLDNTIESIQANVTGSTGKKNKTFKWSLHPWLLVLLPFPPSLEKASEQPGCPGGCWAAHTRRISDKYLCWSGKAGVVYTWLILEQAHLCEMELMQQESMNCLVFNPGLSCTSSFIRKYLCLFLVPSQPPFRCNLIMTTM